MRAVATSVIGNSSVPLGMRKAPRPKLPPELHQPQTGPRVYTGQADSSARPGHPTMTFDELKLAPAILKAVREQGYENPTPIQAQAIPAVLEGRDLLAGAQTGTGKTAAFTLPMLHKLTMSRSATNKFGGYGIRALVLTPTR